MSCSLLGLNPDLLGSDEPNQRAVFAALFSALLGGLVREDALEPKHDVLLLLDELPRFGLVEGLQSSLSYLSSHHVKVLLVMQSMAQLEFIYGPRQSISSLCPTHVAIKDDPNRHLTLKLPRQPKPVWMRLVTYFDDPNFMHKIDEAPDAR